MTRNAKISIILVALVALGGALALALDGPDEERGPVASGTAASPAGEARALRPDSRLLSEGPAGAPELVEFLDFECEGCGALYPIMEELRRRYAGRVTFAIRYFPNEGHANAMNAALAVEAAARQGKLEPMYSKMFETQEDWGEAGRSRAALFARYARGLGLDMARFRRDVADPGTAARIERDRDEGLELGVDGTPSLFLDGERLMPESAGQLRAAIDAALG